MYLFMYNPNLIYTFFCATIIYFLDWQGIFIIQMALLSHVLQIVVLQIVCYVNPQHWIFSLVCSILSQYFSISFNILSVYWNILNKMNRCCLFKENIAISIPEFIFLAENPPLKTFILPTIMHKHANESGFSFISENKRKATTFFLHCGQINKLLIYLYYQLHVRIGNVYTYSEIMLLYDDWEPRVGGRGVTPLLHAECRVWRDY